MPTIFRKHGFRFFFYSNEGFEPCHVHIEGHGGEAKFWILPERMAWSYNFNAAQLRLILDIIKENGKTFERKWDEYFNR